MIETAAAAPDGPSLLRVAGALLICCVAALVGALLIRARINSGWKSFGSWAPLRRPMPRRLTMVESVRIDAHTVVTIIRCDDRDYLVSSSEQGARILKSLQDRAGDAGK